MSFENAANRVATRVALEMGVSPADVLADHCARMARLSIVASESAMWRTARKQFALLGSEFFHGVADSVGAGLADVVEFFKDSRVVRLFSKIGWSFSKLHKMFKDGYKAAKDLKEALGDYVAQSGVGRFARKHLDSPTMKAIDEWLQKHPKTRRMGGYALAALVVYMWFVAPFVGNPDWDFDMSEVLDALGGSYSLADMFSGPTGAAFLLNFLAGTAMSVTFPWPGAVSAHFIASVVYTLAKKLGKRLRGATISASDGQGWVGIDLDGTLAEYGGDPDEIGEPVPLMWCRVKLMLEAGEDVRILTARAALANPDRDRQVAAIQAWTMKWFGVMLPVTSEKDPDMKILYDDKAVQVEKNTGRLVGQLPEAKGAFLADTREW